MLATGAIPAAVTVAEFKRAVHIVEGVTDDDVLIAALLAAAQAVVETGARRLLTPRGVQFQYRGAWAQRWWAPVAPVTAVSEVAWQDAAGAWTPLAPGSWRLEMPHDEPQLVYSDAAFAGVTDQAAPVRVTAQAGSAAGQAPEALRQAVILIAKEWLDQGIAVGEAQGPQAPLSFGARALIRQGRYLRPCEVGLA